ncbi:uncharacterized protein A4U43_C08F19680 [Asparagus officinalis]|nr:uncharacterized protein A4U43_C08F19680 [Asparagus officinalis]
MKEMRCDKDTEKHARKLAKFLRCPFPKEEEDGVVEVIVKLCNFENLKEIEANKKDKRGPKEFMIKNSSYFRKGKVRDWKNHLTTEMAQRLDDIVAEKLSGS